MDPRIIAFLAAMALAVLQSCASKPPDEPEEPLRHL